MPANSQPPSAQPCILLIEDDKDMRELVAEAPGTQGVSAWNATEDGISRRQGLWRCRNHPDLILPRPDASQGIESDLFCKRSDGGGPAAPGRRSWMMTALGGTKRQGERFQLRRR